jgi:NF-kappa-B inhibitor-like protein 2
VICFLTGCFEEAILEHEMEKRLCEALDDKTGQAVASRKIGECYCELGSYGKALKLQNQYLALAQECGNKVSIV